MRNVAALRAQSDADYEQIFLVDTVGFGIGASYQRLAHHQPRGDWVWVLDDDDECTYPGLVADVRRIAAEQPEVCVIMARMDHGGSLGVLPDALVWGKSPVLGHLGVSSYIVRRDVWMRHAHAFGSGHYASDYDFIAHVWRDSPAVYWHDVIASRCNRISRGAPEGAA